MMALIFSSYNVYKKAAAKFWGNNCLNIDLKRMITLLVIMFCPYNADYMSSLMITTVS